MINLKKYFGLQKPLDAELFEHLLERKFTVKIFDKEISYRTINYWDEKGYLLTDREKAETDWRKLSFTDYIWIRMLDEIRKMGISVETAIAIIFKEFGFKEEYLEGLSEKQLKNIEQISFEKLLTKIDKELISVRFCFMLVNIISFKSPLALRIYTSGKIIEKYANPYYVGIRVEEFEDSESEKIKKEFGQNFISVSISNLVADYIDLKELDNIETLNLLSKEELELLKHIRNKDLKEVSIVLEDGIPIKLELSEISYNADISKRISEDMLGKDYIECSYITNGNKQVTFRRTRKIKLK